MSGAAVFTKAEQALVGVLCARPLASSPQRLEATRIDAVLADPDACAVLEQHRGLPVAAVPIGRSTGARLAPLVRPSPPPLASEIDLLAIPGIGASTDLEEPLGPYVPRNADQVLVAAYDRRAAAVVVVGPAASGKSRTAVEMLTRALPSHRLVAPRPGQARRILDDPDLLSDLGPVVLWLDELRSHPDLLAYPAGLVLPEGVILAATATLPDAEDLVGRLRIAWSGDWFGDVEVVSLASTLDAEEAGRARALYPHIAVETGDDLSERLRGPRDMAIRLSQLARACPGGRELVLAALAWSLTGTYRPLDAAMLTKLAATASDFAFSDDVPWDACIDWACRPPDGGTSWLLSAGGGNGDVRYVVHPLLVEAAERGEEGLAAAARVPDSIWRAALDAAAAHDALVMGARALERDELDRAERAFRRAYADPEYTAKAAQGLAMILESRDEIDDAVAFAREAMHGAVDPDAGAHAALVLQRVLRRSAAGREEARRLLLGVWMGAAPELAATAALELGDLDEEGGGEDAAIWYGRAAETDAGPVAIQALERLAARSAGELQLRCADRAYVLGAALSASGRARVARRALLLAVEMGGETTQGRALIELGALYGRLALFDAAEAAYRRAAASPLSEIAQPAAFRLARVLSMRRGGEIEARRILEELALSNSDEDWRAWSALVLAHLSRHQRRPEADQLFAVAGSGTNPDVTAAARRSGEPAARRWEDAR
jgi:hypothetical protein